MCEKKHEKRTYKHPSLKVIFSNWNNSDKPISEKVKMAVKNNFLKIKRGKSCCGNHGEVGC